MYEKNSFIIFLILTLFLNACATKQGFFENTNGKYSYIITHSSLKKQPVICGTLYDYELKTLLRTNAAIKIGKDLKKYTDTRGIFQFEVLPGKYQFIALGVPYEILTTQPIKARLGDTIKFEIYLQVYKKPIY